MTTDEDYDHEPPLLIADVAFNWRMAARRYLPNPDQLILSAEQTAPMMRFVPCSKHTDVIEIRDWLFENCKSKVKLYGRIEWQRKMYTTPKVMKGLVFVF